MNKCEEDVSVAKLALQVSSLALSLMQLRETVAKQAEAISLLTTAVIQDEEDEAALSAAKYLSERPAL